MKALDRIRGTSPKLPRSFVSGTLIIQGSGLALGGDVLYSAHAYDIVFGVMPRIVWAIVFLASGVALLLRRNRVTLMLAVVVLFGWAIGLQLAFWTRSDETGERLSSTPTGGVAWLCVALLTLWSAGKPEGVR